VTCLLTCSYARYSFPYGTYRDRQNNGRRMKKGKRLGSQRS